MGDTLRRESHELVARAKTLAKRVQSSNSSDTAGAFHDHLNMDHLKVVAQRFVDLAELCTGLESTVDSLNEKLSAQEQELTVLRKENDTLRRRQDKVARGWKEKFFAAQSELSLRTAEKLALKTNLERFVEKSERLSKRARQGEKTVTKLQNLCKQMVYELRKQAQVPQINAGSPGHQSPESTAPNTATPQALYDGGFRDFSHFDRYVEKIQERKMIREDMRMKSRSLKARHGQDDSRSFDGNQAAKQENLGVTERIGPTTGSPTEVSVKDRRMGGRAKSMSFVSIGDNEVESVNPTTRELFARIPKSTTEGDDENSSVAIVESEYRQVLGRHVTELTEKYKKIIRDAAMTSGTEDSLVTTASEDEGASSP